MVLLVERSLFNIIPHVSTYEISFNPLLLHYSCSEPSEKCHIEI